MSEIRRKRNEGGAVTPRAGRDSWDVRVFREEENWKDGHAKLTIRQEL